MRSTGVLIGLLMAMLARPGAAAAQDESFVRALAGLHAALQGRYGDEGQEVPRRLDELSAALADWDRSIRDAESRLRPRLEGAGPDEAAGIRETLGLAYLRRSRSADALAEFDAAIRNAPRRARLHVLRAAALDALDRRDDAAMALRLAWTMEPDDPAAAYLALARAKVDGTDLGRVRQTLLDTSRSVTRGLIDRPPSPPFMGDARPVLLAGAADPGPGSGDAGAAAVFALARYADGFALVAEGRYEEGIARLRERSAGDPLLADQAARTDRMRQAVAALRQGSLAAALAAFEAIAQASAGSSEAHRVLATASSLTGGLEESMAHLETALRLRPDDERSWIALARGRVESGSLLDASGTLEAAIKAVPGSGELRWRLAGVAIKLERIGDALEQYGEAARLAPIAGRPQVQQWLATLASLNQDLARAEDAAERRVQLDLNDASAHRDLAAVYVKQGRENEALAELVIAAWLNPDDPLTFVALGQAHMAGRRDEDAVEALERAVSLAPDLREARYALAQALTRAGRRDDARPQLSEFERLRAGAVQRDRRDREIEALRADAARQSREGQHQRAAGTWRKVIALEPEMAQHHVELAEALVRAGQLEASLESFVKAAELDGVAEVHLRLADVLARLGRARESALARQTYERLRLEDFRRSSGR